MKRVLTLIPIVGIITTGFLVSTPKSASAYCVYNKAAFSVHGYDTNTNRGGSWDKSLGIGQRDCCPGNHSECQNATVHVDGGGSSCERGVDAHGWIVVHSTSTRNGIRLDCNVNEPV